MLRDEVVESITPLAAPLFYVSSKNYDRVAVALGMVGVTGFEPAFVMFLNS